MSDFNIIDQTIMNQSIDSLGKDKQACIQCQGKGFVRTGPSIRSVIRCPACEGKGYTIRKEG